MLITNLTFVFDIAAEYDRLRLVLVREKRGSLYLTHTTDFLSVAVVKIQYSRRSLFAAVGNRDEGFFKNRNRCVSVPKKVHKVMPVC